MTTVPCADLGNNVINIFSFSTKKNIQFGAFVTDFTDQYTSNWNTQEIYGRMDPVYTYKNTVRKISIAFDVPAANIQDAKNNFSNASLLIRGLYPIYETTTAAGANVISGPPIFRIKFKNFVHSIVEGVGKGAGPAAGGLLGWIDGYGFKPDMEKGFFEDNDDIYPKLFKVNFNFNVLHEHPLGWGDSTGTKPRYGAGEFPYVTGKKQNTSAEASADKTPTTPAGEKDKTIK